MRKKLARLGCYWQAVKDLIKYHSWIPHIYRDSFEQTIIIADDKSFRISTSLEHKPGESVYPHAGLIKSKCIYCGHETSSWFRNWEERYRYM